MAPSRIAAAILAATAWIGLGIQTIASTDKTGDLIHALLVMSAFFTILTNLGLAILFTGIALGRQSYAHPARVGAAAICILLVGAVYAVLLAPLEHLTGLDQIANLILHRATPALTALWWLAFARQGLTWRHPLSWAAIPFAYLVYAIVRGTVRGHYAYPFLDGTKLGWGTVAVTVTILSFGFLIGGWTLVAIDRWLPRSIQWRR